MSIRGPSIRTWWTRSRPGACSTGWWDIRFLRCCGTKFAAVFRRAACRRLRCGLIVEREREIKAFEKKEYWTIDAHLAASKPPAFDARFVGKGEEKVEVTNGEDAEKIRAALETSDWVVRSVDKKERRRNAAPPFTTSKLQQDSSRKLRFSVKRTMMIAQRLYEGVELGEEGLVGLITYMRTDSTRVAPEAIQEVREYVGKEYGPTIPARDAEYLQRKEGSAGGARGDSPDFGDAASRPDQAVFKRR